MYLGYLTRNSLSVVEERCLILTTYGLCSSSCSREGSCIFWKCLLMLLLLNALKNVIRLTGQIRSLKTIFSSLEDTVHESKCKHRYVYAIPGWKLVPSCRGSPWKRESSLLSLCDKKHLYAFM